MEIRSKIVKDDPQYKESYSYHQGIVSEFEERTESTLQTQAPSSGTKQPKKGSLGPMERIQHLVDEGSQFLELSPLAGYKLYDDPLPRGGLITGLGMIHGKTCLIVANDSRVKGGTYYPITVKKHLRAQTIASQLKLPCLYLVDSGGAFLPMQDEVFPDVDDFGRIFFNQARMSADGIPQISSVHGFCTAGGAYIPAMSDQSVIVKDTGTIFLAGPPLVKAATGEDVTAQELGGGLVHTGVSGVSDHLAQNDEDAMAILRTIVSFLPSRAKAPVSLRPPKEPLYPAEEILGILPKDPKRLYDPREILARIVDGSEFFEFKKNYGTTLVCGFSHIGGIPVGIIANQGVLFSESALKGTHFIELCTQQQIPLLFLQNITGFIVGKEYEHKGIAKDGAKLVHAVANARVPKITLIMGGSFGAGNYGMCGRAYDPNFLFTWPQSRIGVMGGEQAAKVLLTVKEQQLLKKGLSLSLEEQDALQKPILEKYEKESSPYYATSRLWDDGIIHPASTRRILWQALAASLHFPWEKTAFGTFRM